MDAIAHKSRVLAVDPGAHSAGWALFEDDILLSAHFAEGAGVAQRVSDTVSYASRIVVEVPQVYSGAKVAAPSGDLINVAYHAGEIVGTVKARQIGWVCAVEAIPPARWKGQAPKDVIHGRVRACLDAVETAVLESCLTRIPARFRHNALDAVGIGLWAIGRRERGIK